MMYYVVISGQLFALLSELLYSSIFFCETTLSILTYYYQEYIRRNKLNSQFIVTKFSILHAGGRSDDYSDFKPVKRARKAMFELEIADAPPSNKSARGDGAKVPYIYCIVSEI